MQESHRYYAALGVVLTLVALMMAPTLFYPPGADQATFTLVGEGWFHGAVPYKDLWDAKPPGIFLVYGVARAVFGPTLWSVRAMDVLWTLGTCLALAALARRVLCRHVGLVAALLYGSHMAIQSYWELGQSDPMASLPVLLGTVVFIDAIRAKKVAGASAARAVLAGGLFGFAALLKTTAAAQLVVLFAILACEGESILKVKRSHLVTFGLALAGIVAVPLATLAYFAAAGGLTDLLEAMFVWGPRYASHGMRHPLEVVSDGIILTHKYLWSVPLLTAPALAAIAIEASAGRLRRLLIPLALLFGATVMFVAQLKFYLYHLMAVYPALALLGGHGFVRMGQAIKSLAARRDRIAAFGILGLCVLSSVPLQAARPAAIVGWLVDWSNGRLTDIAYYRRFTASSPPSSYSFADDLEVARFVASISNPGDSLFVWGFNPAIYSISGRPPASRFISHFPVLAPWTLEHWPKEVFESFATSPPATFVVSHKEYGSWLSGQPGDAATHLSTVPELAHLLETRYELVATVATYDVYRMRR